MRAALLALAAVLLAGPAWASPADEIRQRLEQWRDDFNAGRTKPVCDLFAPDIVSSYQGRPDLAHAGICAQLARAMAVPDRRLRYDVQIQDILVDGDLAAVRLVWTLVVDTAAGTETTRDQGLDVFRRQADGAWRIVRFIAYPLQDDAPGVR